MAATDFSTAASMTPRRERSFVQRVLGPWSRQRLILQILLALGVLAAWEFLPKIDVLAENFRFLDPFVISGPSAVWDTLYSLVTGRGEAAYGLSLWAPLWWTIRATLLGTLIGLVLGAAVGLLFSQSKRVTDVISPFIVVVNTIPRVALIPLFIIIAKPGLNAEILSVISVVFFLAFFNAFEGGRSLKPSMIDNATLLGASSLGIMLAIRLPVVIQWTFAVVPNAISFGLVIGVTAELLGGLPGMGNVLLTASTTVNSALTWSIVVVLAIVGLILYFASNALYKLVVRW